MNLLTRIFAVGSMLVASHVFAAGAFEGKVTLTMTGEKGKPVDLNYSMKGERFRIDMNASGQEMSTIMDLPKREMIILMSGRNMYMVMPLRQPAEQAMQQHEGEAANVDINRTGKTETILGYKTEQLLITDKDNGTVTELWMAPDLGTFMGLGDSGGSPFGGHKPSANAAKWEEALKGSKGGFPLRVITHDAKSKQTFKMEATKIEPGPLPESSFVPPAGYQKFEMPNLGGMNPFKHE
ncbi:MAG TPA: DUF4412 domain-containing protein [Lacunisphaera sp.]|jgi:hypothetical protein